MVAKTLSAPTSQPRDFWRFALELAHEPLHHAANSGCPSKTVLQTEAVAFVVSHAFGLDTNLAWALSFPANLFRYLLMTLPWTLDFFLSV